MGPMPGKNRWISGAAKAGWENVGGRIIFAATSDADVDSKTNIAASNYAKRKKKCEVRLSQSILLLMKVIGGQISTFLYLVLTDESKDWNLAANIGQEIE